MGNNTDGRPTTDPISKAEWGALTQAVKDMREDISLLKTSIIGNGKPGMMTRLDRVEQFRDTITKIFWAFIVPINLGVLSFIIAVLTHRIELVFK